MSRSHFIFRDVPMDAWVDRYKKSHQRRINRVVQTFGIPMIAVSIPLFLIAPLVRGFWKIPLSLFTAGWIFQVLGHIIEGKPPEQSNAQALEAPSLQLAAFPSRLRWVNFTRSDLVRELPACSSHCVLISKRYVSSKYKERSYQPS